MTPNLPDSVAQFIRLHLDSIWALELFLKLARSKRAWRSREMVFELRAADHLVQSILMKFQNDGLVEKLKTDLWQWAPQSEELAKMGDDLIQIYDIKPFTVMQVIAETSASSQPLVKNT